MAKQLYKFTMVGKSEEEVIRLLAEQFPEAEYVASFVCKPVKLKELSIGDKFVSVNAKEKIVFEVVGNPKYNTKHGSPTRLCKNGETHYSKSCRLDVVKL